MKKTKSIIQLKNIKKEFRTNGNRRIVLSGVDLKIFKGERVGIVGPNGSGKTTLLEILSGIKTATAGTVLKRGKIVTLMNLESGFYPELNGEDNIMVNGVLAGMNRKEVFEKKEKIIEFSGIKEYINQPFYTYSSGMKFRLAFSVAIFSDCDVLVVDEIFTAGDLNFQSKSVGLIKKLQKNGLTTVICSHVPFFIYGLSSVIYELKSGKLSAWNKNDYAKLMVESDLKKKQALGVRDFFEQR